MGIAELRRQVQYRRELPSPAVRRDTRIRAKATQAELALACEDEREDGSVRVSRSSIAAYEAGTRTPTGKRLERYLEVLAALEDAAR